MLGCLFETALYSVRTLTGSMVSPVSLNRVIELFDIQPRDRAVQLLQSPIEEAIVWLEKGA